MEFQKIWRQLENFWLRRGCVLWHPYNVEVGAGTLNPATFFGILGEKNWRVVYLEPSVRPADGRYGENPVRLYLHHQIQVILKPPPADVQSLYLKSLASLGIRTAEHDIRFIEDNWESPTLGAWGLGWEVWLDGLEITQFTYMQQAGGFDLSPVACEITYGLDRIANFLQGKRSVFELAWSRDVTFGQIHKKKEKEYSQYAFELAEIPFLFETFDRFEEEAERILKAGLVFPAYDYVLKLSHLFNWLDARKAISVSERVRFIARVRKLAKVCAELYLSNPESVI
ncbi:MAG TPA: glycine--tRNA ligase subunit alpha [bacterium]|nr:glycine--tRNA ligase subunit alpha [bacterium]